MAALTLLIVVLGLGLLPVVYLARSRARWAATVRAEGVATQGTVVSIHPLTATGRRASRTWVVLTFEYRPVDQDAPVRVAVHALARDTAALGLAVGQRLPVRYRAAVVREAVPEELDCRAAGP